MFGSVASLARDVRAAVRSPMEIVEESLASIEDWQERTNAFSQLRAEGARREARLQADALVRGEDPGPLCGVPVAVKDLFDVEGMETTGCCRAFRGQIARSDAEAVARWRRTGAIVVAKTNQHELAAGGTNVVSACGPTRNPWDTSRMTGGSSGGSAAAVAAGSVPLALGSDTGGSIRIPASFCGVSGLKPTTGRIRMGGAMPLAISLDTAGPIAATVEDVAVAFGVLAGEDLKLGGGDRDSLRGQRVGLLGGFFRDLADPEVLQAVDGVAEVLGEAGLDVERVEAKGIDDAADVWSILCWSEFADRYGTLLDEPESVLEETRRLLEYGRSVSPGEREGARLRSAEIRASFLEVLRGVEVLLAPATPHAAPKAVAERVGVAGGFQVVHRGGPAWFTRPISLAGLPALSIPAGFSSEGLPLGVQLIGGPGEEWRLFSVGEAYQSATDHHRRVPTSER